MALTASIIITDGSGVITATPAVGGSASQTSGTTLTATTVTAAANTDAAKQGVLAQAVMKALQYIQNNYAQASDVDTDN